MERLYRCDIGRNRMITHSETIIVTHDDPHSEHFKKLLTEENGWIIKSDTFATSYSKTNWYRVESGEKQNEAD